MRRHRFDPVSAVTGSAFMLIAASAVVGDSSLSLLESGRVWAMLLLLGGVALLVVAVRRPESAPSAVDAGPPPEFLVQPTTLTPSDTGADAEPEDPPFLTEAEQAIAELRAMSSDAATRRESDDGVNLAESPNDEEGEGPDGR